MDWALQSAFVAEASTLLVLLAGAVLLYNSFREKYLVLWIAGWTIYGTSKLFAALGASPAGPGLWIALANAAFAVAVGLFAGSIFLYVWRKRLLFPAGVATVIAVCLGVSAAFFPDSQGLSWAFTGCWFLVLAVAAFWLVRFALGRRNIGHWILAFSLLLLHTHQRPTLHSIVGYDILVDLLLGVGMMLIVLDDSRVQVARLGVLNTITNEISQATEFEPMVDVVLRELLRHTKARSSSFRKLHEGSLVLTAQKGLSVAFAEEHTRIDVPLPGRQALKDGKVQIVPISEMPPALMDRVAAEGIRYLVVIPVQSRSADIGVLVLGMRGHRTFTENDKNFLQAAAKQLGLAAENRGLVLQLVRSRNEWASTFNSIPDYILVHDHEYRILRANRALLDRLELTRTGVIHQFCEAVLPGAGTQWHACPYCGSANPATASEYDPCFGGYSVVSTSAYAGEDVSQGATIHVIKDTTETRAAEQRYKALFSHMQEGVFVTTPEGKVIDCNDAFVRMLGYASKEEILRLEAAESVHRSAEDQEKFSGEMSRQGFVRNFEYRLRRRDGREISVSESSFATRGPSGRMERYQGVLLDVTEIKRAEEEVRRRNRELHVLNNIAVTFNQSFDLDEILHLTMQQIVELFSTDTSAVYLFDEATSALQKKSSYGHRSSWVTENENFVLPQEFVETLRSTRVEIISHHDLPRLPAIFQKFVGEERLRAWLWMILWRKDKILGLLGTSSRVLRDFSPSDESVMIGVGRQLATTIEKIQLYHETRRAYEDLRRAQEQLLQSEKMSAVGQLISGVAHELNNPLTAIIGYTQLLESEQLDERIQEYVRKLHKQTQRTQKIVQNLLSFARQHKPQKVHVDLRGVVEDAIALRNYDLNLNNVLVERDFDPALPAVMGDPHQLEQVCLNIINNAADAIMEGPAKGQVKIRLFTEDAQVVTEFHDSGPGIAEPKRVFDPFYTTKGVGKGTGLGLSICYGIVQEHGGEILVRNHAAGGAVVQVRLPAAVGAKPITERERIVARRESQLEGRVLLLDDEEDVLDFEREVLANAGLSVVTARSGAEALEKLQAERFDAVILDSKIPGKLSSTDVYHWLQEQQPDLAARTALVSSNASDPSGPDIGDITMSRRLVKPFDVSDLLTLARRLLRKAVAAARQS